MLVLRWQTLHVSGIAYPKPLPCPNCREPRQFNIDMTYSWCAIFLACGIVAKQQQTLCCATCRRELRPPPPDTARYAARHIPWYQRHGLMAFVTVILVMSVLMAVGPR